MAKLRPGQNAPETGTYSVKDKKGKTVNTVNVSEGDRMPPTQQKNQYFEKED